MATPVRGTSACRAAIYTQLVQTLFFFLDFQCRINLVIRVIVHLQFTRLAKCQARLSFLSSA